MAGVPYIHRSVDSNDKTDDVMVKVIDNTVAYSDGHMQVMSASTLAPGDCVVLISNSGRTRDLLDACDIARGNGATTIIITASGTPLASAGHIHLSADHPEGFDQYSPMVSRLLHLMVIDILANCMALHIGGDRLQPLLSGMKKIICVANAIPDPR